jgi:S-adenosylmethionine:tRNA ribosyltransferase-isomerase
MVSTGKGLGPGARLAVGPGMDVEVLGEEGGAVLRVRLHHALGDDASALERHGRMPLPPYIRRAPDDPRAPADRERYQTVYARQEGAVAAPTAGLHFTEALLGALRNAGVGEARLTLHVGPGTFRPVRAERIEDHAVDPERFRLPEATAAACGACRSAGGRVVAVGTTVARVLESRARPDGSVEAGEGWCDLYIRPGHPFRAVDALVTNLHLPRSSLLILVSAFAGRERILAAYAEAVARRLRFYSYGDAMLIL